MAIDTSKLRKRLPPPPADGNPAVETGHATPAPALIARAQDTESIEAAIPVLDGRSLRRTGRTEQLNVKVRPETKARLVELAQARGVGMSVLIEQLIGEAAP